MDTAIEPSLSRIEQVLTELTRLVTHDATRIPSPDSADADTTAQPHDATRRLDAAIAWLRIRKARDKALGADLFVDPGWSMLLDLFVNQYEARPVSVTSLSLGANVPPTTGTRWIGVLESAGLIRREADRNDRRRTLVYLTEQGLSGMNEALDRAIDGARALGIEHMGRSN